MLDTNRTLFQLHRWSPTVLFSSSAHYTLQ
jgi:hypothetical protein